VSTDEITIVSQPTQIRWSNIDALVNGGTEIFPNAVIAVNNPPTTGTLTVTGSINYYGTLNVLSELDAAENITVATP
jgi:hypothetical protein